MTFGNVARAESGQTELHDGAIVQDLGSDVGLGNGILQVRHQEQVARLVIPSASRVVEDMAQDRTGTEKRSVRVVDGDAEKTDEGRRGERSVKGCNARGETLHAGSGKGLEVFNDIVGLGVQVLDAAHDGTDDTVGPRLALKQGLRLGDERVQWRFLAQAGNVVGALFVRVSVLQGLGELHVSSGP